MALWNRTSSKPEPKPQLEPWEYAKQVTEAEWKSGELPLGWYCFTPNNVVWIGLKPDDTCTQLICSPAMQRPQDLDEWLGIPTELTLHPERIPKKESFEELMRQIRGNSSRTAITPDQEPERVKPTPKKKKPSGRRRPNQIHLWLSDAEYEQLQRRVARTNLCQNEFIRQATLTKKKKPSGRRRPNQIHLWLSDAEYEQLQRRVARTNLCQNEFIRQATLTGRIQIVEQGYEHLALLDELEALRAEIGRQGGLLKMIIKPNEGQRELAPEEWNELIQTIRDLEHFKKRLGELESRL